MRPSIVMESFSFFSPLFYSYSHFEELAAGAYNSDIVRIWRAHLSLESSLLEIFLVHVTLIFSPWL